MEKNKEQEDNRDRVVHSNTATTGMSSDLPGENKKQPGAETSTQGASLNDEKSTEPMADEGQGSAGVQGQYAGNNFEKPGENREDLTAPDRADKDKMNQPGSSHLALGGRDGNKSEQIP